MLYSGVGKGYGWCMELGECRSSLANVLPALAGSPERYLECLRYVPGECVDDIFVSGPTV